MKKIVLIYLGSLLLFACNESAIEKPDNLIEEDKMVDIIYDLTLLEAIRSSEPNSLETRQINPSNYVYKRYKIDSLQFAKSDHYYASNVNKYAKIYDRVSKRIENNKAIIDSAKAKRLKPKATPAPAK